MIALTLSTSKEPISKHSPTGTSGFFSIWTLRAHSSVHCRPPGARPHQSSLAAGALKQKSWQWSCLSAAQHLFGPGSANHPCLTTEASGGQRPELLPGERPTRPTSSSHNCKRKAYIIPIRVHTQNKPQGWQRSGVSLWLLLTELPQAP